MAPTTEAGRRLLDWDHNGAPMAVGRFADAVREVEREATIAALAMPRDKIAIAIHNLVNDHPGAAVQELSIALALIDAEATGTAGDGEGRR